MPTLTPKERLIEALAAKGRDPFNDETIALANAIEEYVDARINMLRIVGAAAFSIVTVNPETPAAPGGE